MSSKIQNDFWGRCGVGVPFKNDKPIRFNKIFPGHATIVQMSSKIQKDILGRCGVGVPFKNDKPIRFNKI